MGGKEEGRHRRTPPGPREGEGEKKNRTLIMSRAVIGEKKPSTRYILRWRRREEETRNDRGDRKTKGGENRE